MTKWFKKSGSISSLFYAGFVLIFITTIVLYCLRSRHDELNFTGILLVNIFVSIAGITFINIWDISKPTLETGKPDYGLVCFSGAMACWSLSAVYQGLALVYHFDKRQFYNLGNAFFSSANSLCFLLSIPYFTYKQSFFNHRIIKAIGITEKNYVQRIKVWTGFVFIILLISNIIQTRIGSPFVFHPEFLDALLLGVLTVGSLSMVFWKSFSERNYKWVAGTSLIILAFTLIIQFYRAWHDFNNIDNNTSGFDLILLVSYKILLIIIFFALAFSWSQENSINQIAGERKDMTHTIRDSLILLNADFVGLEDIEDARTKDILLKYQIMIQFTLETHKHMHDEQSLHENLKDYFDKRIAIIKQLLHFNGERSLVYQNDLSNEYYVSNDLKKNFAFFITELILNAAKYSPPANMKIYLRLSFIKNYLTLQILDNGPGLSEDKAKTSTSHGYKRIFEKVKHYRGLVKFNESENKHPDYPGADIIIQIPVQPHSDES